MEKNKKILIAITLFITSIASVYFISSFGNKNIPNEGKIEKTSVSENEVKEKKISNKPDFVNITKEEALKKFGKNDIKEEILSYLDEKGIKYKFQKVSGKEIFNLEQKDYSKFGKGNKVILGSITELIMNNIVNISFKFSLEGKRMIGYLDKTNSYISKIEVIEYIDKEREDGFIDTEIKVLKTVKLGKKVPVMDFFLNQI